MTRPRGPLFQVVAFGVVLISVAVLLAPTSRSGSGAVHGIAATLAGCGAPAWLASEDVWEPLLNVLLFVPLGALATVLVPRWPVARLILMGLVLSASVELAQWLVLPARHGSLVDVVTNTAGTALGVLAARGFGVDRAHRGPR